MGKIWKAASIFGGLAVTTFVAYTQSPPTAWYSAFLFIASIVATALFVIVGVMYLILLIRRYYHPLDILDEIRCTYWPKEKQVQVRLWICDYSNSREFKVSCLAQFGSQIVDVKVRSLDGPYIGNIYCRGGRKRMVEFLKNDVEVKDSSQCLVTILMKPLGMWATRKKSKELATEVVNH